MMVCVLLAENGLRGDRSYSLVLLAKLEGGFEQQMVDKQRMVQFEAT